jgi:hypothetical protein
MIDLCRLCYVSHSRVEPERHGAELQDILATATMSNRATGITGALIVSGGYFCQVIEGACASVEQLFESIQMDDRHADITVLEFVPIADRLFPAWDMAYFDIDHDRANDNHVRQLVQRLQMVETGHNIVQLFGQLIEKRERNFA